MACHFKGMGRTTRPGSLQLEARHKRRDTYPELPRSPRCHLVVSGVETGGCWGPEPTAFLRLSAQARRECTRCRPLCFAYSLRLPLGRHHRRSSAAGPRQLIGARGFARRAMAGCPGFQPPPSAYLGRTHSCTGTAHVTVATRCA